jgi:ADP-dependent NAD(P)H-hydrate dehydratase / NAD(P)H-hydrate epimerase
MRPVVTPAEMAAIDAAAPEPVEELIERAGAAVARAALGLLGGTYGRRVVVVAGPGNNGADGRSAARRLARRGVRVQVLDVAAVPALLRDCDLVIDAAFGTGLRDGHHAPDPAGAPVLAVDIPSGVSGLTGEAMGSPPQAVRTVTFAALKPGLLLHPGRGLAGEITVADIGLDTSGATAGAVEAADVAAWVPARAVDAHKWRSSVLVVAGAPGMTGAAHLVASAAQRAGAGMVRLATPGVVDDSLRPTEAVGLAIPVAGWDSAVLEAAERAGALALGPGLGPAAPAAAAVRRVVGEADRPVVVDGDGLTALGRDAREVLARRSQPAVLTPHDGEAERLLGRRPGPDRLSEARALAAETGAIVLLKGATTIVADPDGRALFVTTGDERLATAGTGDVLTGTVAALLARGTPALEAAAAGAWLHGRAAAHGPRRGLVASDVVAQLPAALAEVG